MDTMYNNRKGGYQTRVWVALVRRSTLNCAVSRVSAQKLSLRFFINSRLASVSKIIALLLAVQWRRRWFPRSKRSVSVQYLITEYSIQKSHLQCEGIPCWLVNYNQWKWSSFNIPTSFCVVLIFGQIFWLERSSVYMHVLRYSVSTRKYQLIMYKSHL